jgi:hypothetical protein
MLDSGNNGSWSHTIAFASVDSCYSCDRRRNDKWTQHLNNLGVTAVVLKSHQTQRCIPADHGISVSDQLIECLMKRFRRVVLTHYPGSLEPNFGRRMIL